jgi:pyruvate, orthophosphate dikinase
VPSPDRPSTPNGLDKLERIRQLQAHGLNTPRIELIEAGTPVDANLRRRLRAFAEGDEKMTVRTYHAADEVGRAKGPFVPEAPLAEAIAAVEELVGEWNVLFQEAIDVEETLLAGNLVLSGSGWGEFELLRGAHRVRDVDEFAVGVDEQMLAGRFESPAEIEDPELREAVECVLRSRLLQAVSPQADEAIVLELNVQRRPVGVRRQRLLWWEWRPLPRLAAPSEQQPVMPAPATAAILSLGVPGLPEPPAGDRRPVLGGKGAGLAAACQAGLPVPPGFAIVPAATEKLGEAELDAAIAALLEAGRAALDRDPAAARFAVRSSPVHSMPGMLDTVLDVEPRAAAVRAAIAEVRESWGSDRARLYRGMHGLAEEDGLAVVVQQMVFPDLDERSGSGVGFTRDPRTGEQLPVIEYVRGRGTPLVSGAADPADLADLAADVPGGKRELERWIPMLEEIGGDVEEFEFAFERGRPFLLQMRAARQTPIARVLSAYDLWREDRIEEDRAALLIDGLDLDRLDRQRLSAGERPLAEARVAAPGVAVGRVALGRRGLQRIQRDGDPVVLLLDSVSTEDYRSLREVEGVVARVGGVTSHAAVVALEAGIVALVGCRSLRVEDEPARIGDEEIAEGDWISIEGNGTGRIFTGRLGVEAVSEGPDWGAALGWAREAQPDPA